MQKSRIVHVSIHAPAQGATLQADTVRQLTHVSIPPAQGATYEGGAIWPTNPVSIHAPRTRATTPTDPAYQVAMFRSTPPHKGRPSLWPTPRLPRTCLDPRPTRGATMLTWASRTRSRGFNPRPCTRGDFWQFSVTACSNQFRSTPPHKGRPWPSFVQSPRDCFDPRPRTRGDHPATAHVRCKSRFNPRPRTSGRPEFSHPRSARRRAIRKMRHRLVLFQSAPRVRAGDLVVMARVHHG
jgi:hypothetical protein